MQVDTYSLRRRSRSLSKSDRMTVTDDFDVTHPIPVSFREVYQSFAESRSSYTVGEFYLTASEAKPSQSA